MKLTLKLEELGLLILFSSIYFQFYDGSWWLYLGLFFVPDVSFALFLITKKLGAIAYNVFHHKGVLALVVLSGLLLKDETVVKIGLIFIIYFTFIQ
jgi:hypothetical protein